MNARPARLFVSHSSHSEHALRRLDALVGALGGGEDRVEVLHDRGQISTGDDWRRRINAMLAQCDGAILLLTPEAMASWWVLKEATILTWRRERTPQFPVLPLLLDGVYRDQLRGRGPWAPLDLTRSLLLDVEDVAAAAAAVKKQLYPLRATWDAAPFDVLADDIAQLLGKASRTRCERMCQELDGHPLLDLADHQGALARAISSWMLRQPPPTLGRIARTLTKLGRVFPAEDARRIIELVAPLWVDLDAAAAFAGADGDLAMRCKRPIPVLQHHMTAAHLPDSAPEVLMLNGITAGRQVDDIVSELRSVLRYRLRKPGGPLPSDAEIDRRLNHTGTRFRVALPLPDDGVLAELQRRYDKIGFIYFAPYDGVERDLQGAKWVHPALDPRREHEVCEDYDTAWEQLNTTDGFR